MEGEEVAIVPFEAGRLDELVGVWRASFEAGVGITDPHPLAEQRQYFLDSVLPGNDVRVALLEGRIAGFVAASAESVSQLYVRTDLRGRGIGSRLLDGAKARSGGSLWLFTFERNAGARTFYERHGFVVVARGFEPHWQLADLKYAWTRREPSRGRNG